MNRTRDAEQQTTNPKNNHEPESDGLIKNKTALHAVRRYRANGPPQIDQYLEKISGTST
jgi:hypothetical protein